MLRNARHGKILEIISEKEIETQEELCEELNKCNFSVTQATISRDIKELHLFKVAGINKRFRYTCINENEGELSDKMRSLFRACVIEIRSVGNLIVIKTLNGNGANAGVVIDRLNYKEVVGCVAGDDTTLLICETEEKAHLVRERLNKIIQD
ncbi:MAG: arginine repressor [Clostridia bacterium]|nr:arginine repressor [Clostridia bacterium]